MGSCPAVNLRNLLLAVAITIALIALASGLTPAWLPSIAGSEPLESPAAQATAITLYEGPSFHGQQLSLTSDTTDLTRYTLKPGVTWNDNATSVIVPNGWYAIAYQHTNYQGIAYPILFNTFIADLRLTVLGNNKISSLRIGQRQLWSADSRVISCGWVGFPDPRNVEYDCRVQLPQNYTPLLNDMRHNFPFIFTHSAELIRETASYNDPSNYIFNWNVYPATPPTWPYCQWQASGVYCIGVPKRFVFTNSPGSIQSKLNTTYFIGEQR